MRKRGLIASARDHVQQFRVGRKLSGKGSRNSDKLPQNSRLFSVCKGQGVMLESWLNQGIKDVSAPALVIGP